MPVVALLHLPLLLAILWRQRVRHLLAVLTLVAIRRRHERAQLPLRVLAVRGVTTGDCTFSDRTFDAGACSAIHWSDTLSRLSRIPPAPGSLCSFCSFSRCASILPRCRRAAFHRFA
eukprot:5626973-Prymnesium_polylepis.1